MPFKLSSKICRIWSDEDLAEEPQIYDTKFAFANSEGDTVYPLFGGVMCRDFLLDAMVWQNDKMPSNFLKYIYGFNYTEPLVNFNKTELYITGTLAPAQLQKIMNEIEVAVGIVEHTKIHRMGENAYYVVSDSQWMRSTARLSLYTWLLREYAGRNATEVLDKGVLVDAKTACGYGSVIKEADTLLDWIKRIMDLPLPPDGQVGTSASKTMAGAIHSYSGCFAATVAQYNFSIYGKGGKNASA